MNCTEVTEKNNPRASLPSCSEQQNSYSFSLLKIPQALELWLTSVGTSIKIISYLCRMRN